MHPSPGLQSTPAAIAGADNVSNAGQTEPMSNIASGRSSEHTLNQETRPGDAVANNISILGFPINDTDREPPFKDDTVLVYKAQPAKLVRILYTAIIDISEMRDLPRTKECRYLTEMKRGIYGKELYYDVETLVALCWRVAWFMLDGAEKGFVRANAEPQRRSFDLFEKRLSDATDALKREKSVLGALLHNGTTEIIKFVYDPHGFEKLKSDHRSRNRNRLSKKKITDDTAAVRKKAVCMIPAWEKLPEHQRGMSAKDANTWLNKKERIRGSGIELPLLSRQRQPQEQQEELTGDFQQAEEQEQAEGQAQSQGQSEPEGHPATTPPSQRVQPPQQLHQPPTSSTPAEIAGPQPSMLTPIYPPAPQSAPPSTQLQPQSPASEPTHANTGARQSVNQLRMAAPIPVLHRPSSSSSLRHSTTVENTTRAARRTSYSQDVMGSRARRSSYSQETIGPITPARVTETLGNSARRASTASGTSTYSTPTFGHAPPPRHGPQIQIPTPQSQQLQFGAATSAAQQRRPAPPRPPPPPPPPTTTSTSATTTPANLLATNPDTSSFMSGSPLGVMPLGGYSVGHGRTWRDPKFHGMPSPAAAPSSSVEGTQQGGGDEPDNAAEGEKVGLMDVDRGSTQGGSSGSDADAEGEPDPDFMDVDQGTQGAGSGSDADAEGEPDPDLMDVNQDTQGGGSGSDADAEGEDDPDFMDVEAVPGDEEPIWRRVDRFRH